MTSPLNFIASRYFKRLEEALSKQFPHVAIPSPTGQETLSDFHITLQKLFIAHDLPGLGFDFGCRIRVSDYGVVGLAMASTRSLFEALMTQLKFLTIIADTSKIRYELRTSDKWIRLQLHKVERAQELEHFIIETELGAQLRFVMDLLPSADMSRCILSLPFQCPTTRLSYEETGQCQIKFNQDTAQLLLPIEWAEKKLESSDELLASMLVNRCQMILSEMKQGSDWVLNVRHYLLTSDFPHKSLGETAAALGVSSSNLRWHLAKTSTNYKQILLDIKMQLACQYLEDTPLTLQQISYQLGYNYHSNFQLAFKKVFGVAPGEWKASRASGVSGFESFSNIHLEKNHVNR